MTAMLAGPANALDAVQPDITSEEPAVLEKLVITAAERREMAIRTIRYGLRQPRSSRFEDAHKVVCRYERKPNSYFHRLICGTNSRWNNWSEEQIGRFADGLLDGNRLVWTGYGKGSTPYTTDAGQMFVWNNVSRGNMKKLITEVTGEDTDEENELALRKHLTARAIGFAKSRQGYENETLIKFVNALKSVRLLETRYADEARTYATVKQKLQAEETLEQQRQAAITAAGIGVDLYDRILADSYRDDILRAAVERGLRASM
ncbi:MAG: hypothetical protein MJA83_13160 [Gammaproteobacteria bacterium]|nr:hypothetical protein [Gammaproteobacteria bacterium]